MEYLRRHLSAKENPESLLKGARSAIVVAAPYPETFPDNFVAPFRSLKVAGYAQGEDYHFWLKQKLEGVVASLKQHYPTDDFFIATDSSPILERDLAYRAGLGWVGKNTCLIDQKRGSFFLLGEILTTISLSAPEMPHPDRCGTCTRCIDACPTGALVAPRKMDARLCISYLTIESKDIPDQDLRPKIGDHFFGCDICQTVCPWNDKPIVAAPDQTETLRELKYILSAPDEELQSHIKRSPLERSRAIGLKRNAIIVAANLKLHELHEEISLLAKEPRLSEISAWALKQLQH